MEKSQELKLKSRLEDGKAALRQFLLARSEVVLEQPGDTFHVKDILGLTEEEAERTSELLISAAEAHNWNWVKALKDALEKDADPYAALIWLGWQTGRLRGGEEMLTELWGAIWKEVLQPRFGRSKKAAVFKDLKELAEEIIKVFEERFVRFAQLRREGTT